MRRTVLAGACIIEPVGTCFLATVSLTFAYIAKEHYLAMWESPEK
jgi:hypothetical protein